ncbi:MAG: M16 family metallopeptidase [Gemmatimonadota bacterium]
MRRFNARWLCTALGILVASSGVYGQASPERRKEKPPVGGRPKDFSLPAKETFRLGDGLEVTLVPYGAVPKVLAQLTVRTGNIDEGPDQVWLADLTGDLMKEGTTTRSAEQIARAAAAMGGEIRIGVGQDRTSVSGEVLSDFAPEIVRLIADVVRHPALPESELERLKGDRIRQLSVAKQQPRSITLAEFRRRMYPDHPYGRIFPTETMLRGYTIDQVRDFWASHFGAARSHLYVSGRFDPEALRSAITEAFGDWAAGTAAQAHPPEPVTRRAIYLIDRPGAPQATVYLGLPVIDPSDPDWVPLQVTNSLLGGSFGSRITRNIREDKGYTYSPFSQVSTRYRDGYWVEVADVTTAATGPAIREILNEIDRLRAEPPDEEELRGIQNYMAGIFVLQNSNRAGIIGQLSFLDLHGLTDEYLTGYVNRVYSVTAPDVQRIANDYLRSEDMLLVVTGDRSKIASQLRRFGPVTEVRPPR